jgi:ethanolamine utilization protein EutA
MRDTGVSEEPEGGRVVFAKPRRNLADEEETRLISVGVDIGSSTTHLVFSRLKMEQRDGRYMVAERDIIFESDIFLTPYSDADSIDADALRAFIAEQYGWAQLTPDKIDTGALILTGVAVRRKNARVIGELFSLETGKFVSVSAGDHLEAAMAAHGSGAVLNSGQARVAVMNVDIGGGTTKIAICDHGAIVDLTAVDIGARLVALDTDGRIVRIEEAGKVFAAACGVTLAIGSPPPPGAMEAMAEAMAGRLAEIITLGTLSAETRALLRLPAMKWNGPIDAVTFSGGVSEYVYGYEKQQFGDLGLLLARAVRACVETAGLRVMESVENIRATVVGASQYTIQLSGTTIFIAPDDILPLRNVPVIAPGFALDLDQLDETALAAAVEDSLRRLDLSTGEQPVAICFDWLGSASYQRTHTFLKGVTRGLAAILENGHPLVLVCQGDIGRVFGIHAAEELKIDAPIVSIDGIALSEFDFIDIGAILPGSGAAPVVIKSLLFPNSAALGTAGAVAT